MVEAFLGFAKALRDAGEAPGRGDGDAGGGRAWPPPARLLFLATRRLPWVSQRLRLGSCRLFPWWWRVFPVSGGFLIRGAVLRFNAMGWSPLSIPTGLKSSSPGLRGTSYLGNTSSTGINSERVESAQRTTRADAMAQSLAKILLHADFSTKDRRPFLRDDSSGR